MTNPYDPYHQGQGYPYQGSPAGGTERGRLQPGDRGRPHHHGLEERRRRRAGKPDVPGRQGEAQGRGRRNRCGLGGPGRRDPSGQRGRSQVRHDPDHVRRPVQRLRQAGQAGRGMVLGRDDDRSGAGVRCESRASVHPRDTRHAHRGRRARSGQEAGEAARRQDQQWGRGGHPRAVLRRGQQVGREHHEMAAQDRHGGDDRRFRHESVDRSHRIEVRRAERQRGSSR